MDRKEMLITIAAQSGCSLRHVRKVLFNRAAENKVIHKDIKFWKALFNKNANWVDRGAMSGPGKYRVTNAFEVCLFPSGYVVLFYVDTDGDWYSETYGARLTTNCGFARRHMH